MPHEHHSAPGVDAQGHPCHSLLRAQTALQLHSKHPSSHWSMGWAHAGAFPLDFPAGRKQLLPLSSSHSPSLAKQLLWHSQHPFCDNSITKHTRYGDTLLLLASPLFHNHNNLSALSPFLFFFVSLLQPCLQDEQMQPRPVGAGGPAPCGLERVPGGLQSFHAALALQPAGTRACHPPEVHLRFLRVLIWACVGTYSGVVHRSS